MQVAFLTLLFIALASAGAGGTNCPAWRTCTDCVTCTSTQAFNSTHSVIVLNTLGCKGSAISWLCCVSGNCDMVPGSCLGDPDVSGSGISKCDALTGVQYYVPNDATSITIQVHDGQFAGTKDCTGNNACCGGSANRCQASGVCETTVQLSTCPHVAPPPECTSDAGCQHFTKTCSVGVCKSGSCVQEFLGSSVQCRAAAGLCDQPEFCEADNAYCPDDLKYGETHECRPAVYVGGTTCDQPESCNGVSDDCPANDFLPSGTECRPTHDLCDVPEICTGTSAACPADLRKDWAYTFKCSTTQFLCGVVQSEITQGNGGGFFFGTGSTCGIGTARAWTSLPWPDCLSLCFNATCPNDRGLSNYAEGHCDINTGNWLCDVKADVSTATVLPHCPSWH